MADRAHWDRVKDVFQGALEHPVADRASYLDGACGDDAALRLEVESLLTSHRDAGEFLSRPAAAASPPPVARHIGPYRILGEIGHGGMGTVYGAVRDDDAFPRTVALKLVRAGTRSELVERRFRLEQHILARLQHPNIAVVFDGGTTPDGQPYLVMEQVEGAPITEYCDAQGLGVRGRLAMFRTVCGAVHYAHQNLVVHRDIKPANILVTGEGVPKLLDFGIAKMLASGVDPDTAPTATMLPIMTPEYASPEQVRGLAVTTASDVYSLGVLLYELLSGRRPYEVRTDSLEGIVRAVCETEPRAPSEVMADRPTEPPAARTRPQAAELRGDLDTIVLKALRKEPERRYLSAHELSEDIRRHLEGLPVMARADTLTYRAGKFVGRHQTAVAAAVLVAVSLVGGIVTTLRQARIAEANRRRAERRFDDVRKLANSFLFDVHDQVRELPGSTVVRQRLVATAQEYLDSLAREAEGDLGLQRELAAAYERLGDVQGGSMTANLGDLPGALASYHKALDIRTAVALAPGAIATDDIDLTHLKFQQAVLLAGMGRLSEAETLLRGVTEHLAALDTRGAPEGLRRYSSAAYQRLSAVQSGLGRHELAHQSLEKAIVHGESYCHDHPEDAPAHTNLAAVYYQDSIGLGQRGDHQAALARVRQARVIQESLHQKEPLNQLYVRGLLFSLNGEGLHLGNLGQGSEAVGVYRRALELAEEMLRRDQQDRWAQASVTVAYSALGRGLMAVGDLSSGLTALESGREIGARVVAEDPANAFVQDELAVIDSNIGFGLIARGTEAGRREGCRALERSLDTWRQLQARGSLAPAGAAGMEKAQAAIAACRNAGARPSPPS